MAPSSNLITLRFKKSPKALHIMVFGPKGVLKAFGLESTIFRRGAAVASAPARRRTHRPLQLHRELPLGLYGSFQNCGARIQTPQCTSIKGLMVSIRYSIWGVLKGSGVLADVDPSVIGLFLIARTSTKETPQIIGTISTVWLPYSALQGSLPICLSYYRSLRNTFHLDWRSMFRSRRRFTRNLIRTFTLLLGLQIAQRRSHCHTFGPKSDLFIYLEMKGSKFTILQIAAVHSATIEHMSACGGGREGQIVGLQFRRCYAAYFGVGTLVRRWVRFWVSVH